MSYYFVFFPLKELQNNTKKNDNYVQSPDIYFLILSSLGFVKYYLHLKPTLK